MSRCTRAAASPLSGVLSGDEDPGTLADTVGATPPSMTEASVGGAGSKGTKNDDALLADELLVPKEGILPNDDKSCTVATN